MPYFPCEFEIPDDWLAETGMAADFIPSGRAFDSTAEAVLIRIGLRDWAHGF